tara:strand:- start:806 stop:1396 length:591 start_codon:yes stop_codon:yes gene_type:complete
MSSVRMLLACITMPSALGFSLHGGAAARAMRPAMQAAAPQMLLPVEAANSALVNAPTILLAAEKVRLGLKSEGDELLDEFISSFPLIFTSVLLAAFAVQYAKKVIAELELDITLPELPEGYSSGQLLIYSFFASPALVLAAVFAKEAGAPIPSVAGTLSPVTGGISVGAGLLAKTSMDVWNLVAPVIGLGDAALKY